VRNFAPAVPVLFLCSLGFAQIPVVPRTTTQANPQSQAAALNKSNVLSAAVHSPLTSTDCSFNFNSGADNTFLHFCVTANGNVVEFETPAGHRLATVSRSEGYGICDILGGVDYHDYANAGDNGTFGPATVLSQSATSVKIVRTTTDGSITFTQTITQLPGTSPSAKIVMTLKNNTAVDKAINLTRFMDVDADTTLFNNFDATRNTSEGWNSEFQHGPFGLMLQNVGTTLFTYSGFVQNSFLGPNPCDPTAHLAAGPSPQATQPWPCSTESASPSTNRQP